MNEKKGKRKGKAGRSAVGVSGGQVCGETARAKRMLGRMLLEKSESKATDVWGKGIIGRKSPATASSFSVFREGEIGRTDGVFPRAEMMSRGAHFRGTGEREKARRHSRTGLFQGGNILQQRCFR